MVNEFIRLFFAPSKVAPDPGMDPEKQDQYPDHNVFCTDEETTDKAKVDAEKEGMSVERTGPRTLLVKSTLDRNSEPNHNYSSVWDD